MQGKLFEHAEAVPDSAPLDDEGRVHAIAVSITACPGANRIWQLIGSHAPDEIFRSICRNAAPATQAYCAEVYPQNPLRAAERIIDAARQQSMRVLTYWDADYPLLLREIQTPPIVLYVRGSLPRGRSVAIVGTRRSDARSSTNARRIAHDLAAAGFTVVSGMAVGIDREAHLGALEERGTTIGVLANAIDVIYPWPNRDIYRLIGESQGSALVSEYPPGIIAGKWTFVRRNRIISGLCAGTVVVKAGERSGALITARHAVEQNRDVFACAGNCFDEEYAGCHRLIRNGAVLVSGSEDIISELSRSGDTAGLISVNDPRRERVKTDCKDGFDAPRPDTLAGKILGLLAGSDYEIDAIIRNVTENSGVVNETLVALELEGRIVRNGNLISRI